jgi:predicted ATP-binding protein involved in virulence
MVETNNGKQPFYEQPAIILVDEIDTYLHPKWQRTILNTLVKNFPNTQFIVTTHSPFVANYLEAADGDCLLLRIEKGKGKPTIMEYFYGGEMQNIFYKWMDIEKRPPQVQKQIEIAYSKINVGTRQSLDEAQAIITDLEYSLDGLDTALVGLKMSWDMANEDILETETNDN